jgi:predicted nucleotidyltransferase
MDTDLAPLIQKAAAALLAAGAREVYLFGSASKGKLRPASDVDMAVAGLPPKVFFRAMAAAHDALGRPLDLVDLDDDNDFTRYLKGKGELLRVGSMEFRHVFRRAYTFDLRWDRMKTLILGCEDTLKLVEGELDRFFRSESKSG